MTRRQSATMIALTLIPLPTCLGETGRAMIFVIIIRGSAHEEAVSASRNRAIIATLAPCEIAGRFLPSLNMNHVYGIMSVTYERNGDLKKILLRRHDSGEIFLKRASN